MSDDHSDGENPVYITEDREIELNLPREDNLRGPTARVRLVSARKSDSDLGP